MPLVVDQVVDELAGEQNAKASSAQTLLFTHEGVPNRIVIRVIDCCVVQAGRVETIARIFYSANECVLETYEPDLNQRLWIEMAAVFDSVAKHLPEGATNRLTDLRREAGLKLRD